MARNQRHRIDYIERALSPRTGRMFFVDGDATDCEERASAIRAEHGADCEIVFIQWQLSAPGGGAPFP